MNKPVVQVVKVDQLLDLKLYDVDPSLEYMIKCLRVSKETMTHDQVHDQNKDGKSDVLGHAV